MRGRRVTLAYLESFEAVFSPRVVSDLQPGADLLVGERCEWQASWIIEDGPYAGEWACALVSPRPAPFAWVPESDLRLA